MVRNTLDTYRRKRDFSKTPEPPARLEDSEQAREQAVVIGDPVERRGRDDRVDGLLHLELQQVGHAHVDALRQPPSRLLDHRGRADDRDHPAPRQPFCEHRRHPSGPAARVDDRLVAVQAQPPQHIATHRLERRAQPLIGGGVPVTWWHTRVRYRIRLVNRRRKSTAAG